MSQAKMIVIAIWCLFIAVICIYAPWKIKYEEPVEAIGNYFSPIWHTGYSSYPISLDIERLIIEIIAVTALCGMAFVMTDIFKQR